MNAFNKEIAICDIKLVARRLQVSHLIVLMDKFGLPEARRVGKFHEGYLARRLELANAHQLALFSAVLKTEYGSGQLLIEKYKSSSDSLSFRFFISHSLEQAADAVQLQESFLGGGLDCFVASDDYDASLEEPSEIFSKLKTMDVMLSFVTEHSIASPACNMDVGYALGKGIPVVGIMGKVLPQDMIGFTAFVPLKEGGAVKDVALDVISTLMELPEEGARLTEILVHQLVSCGRSKNAFKTIGFCRKALSNSRYLTAGQIFDLRLAARENEEITKFASGRGPELIEALCAEFEQKLLQIA